MPAKRKTKGRHMPPEAMEALLEASAMINASLDQTEVLNQIASSAAAVVRGEASSVMLLDRAQNVMIFSGACGDRSDVLMGEHFDADLGIAGWVVRTGKSVLAPNAHEHPNWYSGIEEKIAYRTRDLIAAPMIYQGRIIGVVEVINKIDEGPFNETDLSLLQLFANLAAIGTVNAQKFEGLVRENRSLRDVQLAGQQPLIGDSAMMEEVRSLCKRVANSTATVLLSGPTGTGKELAARCIHMHSTRREKPFVAVNCAALPETLLESELFGHEKGAFTGADSRRLGRFELASPGTLFLDEIGEMSLATQVKLLRVLQEREFVRVGGNETLNTDARIIAATNKDLQKEVKAGRFREDLYYRLNVFPIRMPTLRDRREDIPMLVDSFMRRAARELNVPTPSMSAEALAMMTGYDWPGNVRELQNVIERATLLAGGQEVAPAHLPREISGNHPPGHDAEMSASVSDATSAKPSAQTPQRSRRSTSLWDFEKALIEQALEKAGWNQSQAARDLGISRDNLRYRIKKYKIEKPG